MNHPPAMRRSVQGFTLIEILVVAFIIGMTASLISLAVGDDKNKQPPFLEAQTFIQTIDFIGEYAALNGDTIAMFVEPKIVEESPEKQWCYSWKRLRDRSWSDLPEDSAREHCMDPRVEWELEIEGRIYEYDPDLETQPPVLIFSSSGESTPVEMTISERNSIGTPAETQHLAIDLMGETCWAENPKTRDSNKKEACHVR